MQINFFFKYLSFIFIFLFLVDPVEDKPKIPKKREMDDESSDSKKIKTDEITTTVIESEQVISSREISSKKNVCKLKS